MPKAKKTKQNWWANRIVEYGARPANQFLAHELNARRHPAKQREALRGSLDSVGWIAPCVVSAKSGKLLDGHARIEEALSVDEAMAIPFVEIEVSEEEERLILAAFDPITGLATYDKDALSALLKEVQSDDARINDMLAELAGSVGLLLEDRTPGAGGDEYDTTPDAEQTRVEYGDLWQCGEHRVLCGDSTKAEDVGRVMNGQRASLFATDPPYVVGYKGGSHPSTKSNKGASTKDKDWSGEYHEASSLDAGRPFYDQFVKAAIAAAIEPDAAWYCWHASKRQAMLEDVWASNGAFVHQQIIWVKTRAVLTYSVYMWQHEPCLFGWQQGNKPQVKTQWDHYPSTIWSIPNAEIESADHPTSKPIAVFALPIEMHTKPGEICYEPFLGSGSQLIAAERANRRCFAIEIEPIFCNVSISRWEAETNKTAQLLERRSLAQTP